MPAKGAVGSRQQSPTFVVPQGLQIHARRGRDLPGAQSAGRLDPWHHLGHSSTVNPYPGTECNPGGRIPVNDTRTFTGSDDLKGAEFVDTNLHGARFVRADLSGVVMREVDVQGADIDAPWLSDGESFLRVNGVDVIPFVEAELNRRFPGRADRRAKDPDALRAAWATLERTWALPPTPGLAGRSCRSNSRSTPSARPARRPRATAWTCRSSRRSSRLTPRCSRSGPAGWPWCATSSTPSPPTSWPRRGRT